MPIERARPDKDETDVELAVDAAIARGATGLIVIGALGGERIDHALANVALLASADLVGRSAVLLDARSRISLLRGPGAGRLAPAASRSTAPRARSSRSCRSGGDAEGVTTDGLVYPLADEPLALGPARGVSNVIDAPRRDGHPPSAASCSWSNRLATL